MQRLRKYFEAADYQRKFAAELGLTVLPSNLPVHRYETFKDLIASQRSGQLDRLLATEPKAVQVLYLRFGLTSGAYIILDKVGEQMGGITREYVRQLEEKGLNLLGIHED